MLSDVHLAPEAREILAEIEQRMGQVPNLFRTYTHHPPLWRVNWDKLKATMMEGGPLARRLKEIIALLVSQDNGCEYSIQAHSANPRFLGVDEAMLQDIRECELENAGFAQKGVQLV